MTVTVQPVTTCGSRLCKSAPCHEWAAEVQDARISLTPLAVRFWLCEGHDRFYREHLCHISARPVEEGL